jgi:hypothetical protein
MMKLMKRFVWNFEFNAENPFPWGELNPSGSSDLRWEARFFWPEQEIVEIKGLEDGFLDLSRYEIKHREDTYLLMDDHSLNLKIRRDNLLYKPICKRSATAVAYGKKIKLNEEPPQHKIAETPVLTVQELLTNIKISGRKISVIKEALIYKVPTTPWIKLEFAKLIVGSTTYFSLSVETYEQGWVEQVCQHLLGKRTPCDYVTFLKGICPL